MLMRRVPLSCSCHKQSKHWWDIIHCPNGPHCKYCEKVIIWLKIKHGSQSINKIIKIMILIQMAAVQDWNEMGSLRVRKNKRPYPFHTIYYIDVHMFGPVCPQFPMNQHSPKKMVAECCRFLILVSNKP
jgi:hypothetical protein